MTNHVIAIEDGAGTDAATCSCSGTTLVTTSLTLVKDQYFDRNESICLVTSAVGAATSNALIVVQFENIH